MAIDKNSNSYTFGFAILMVIVVGTLLAVASQGLKTRQEKNATDKKMMSILSAINIDATRENAQEMYNKYVIDSKIISGKDLSLFGFIISFASSDSGFKPISNIFNNCFWEASASKACSTCDLLSSSISL